MNIIEMASIEECLQKMLICAHRPATAHKLSTKDEMKTERDTKYTFEISTDIITDYLLNENYEGVIIEFLKGIKYPNTINSATVDSILGEGPLERHLEVISVGVSALQLFVQINWTGKQNIEDSALLTNSMLSDIPKKTLHKFLIEEVNGEEVESVCKNIELLYIAILCLLCKGSVQNVFVDSWSVQWWQLRCLCVHQQVLTEKSDALYHNSLILIEKIEKHFQLPAEKKLPEKRSQLPESYMGFFNLEVSSFHASYFDVTKMAKVNMKITRHAILIYHDNTTQVKSL